MAIKIKTDKLLNYKLDREENLWAYNGVDCAITSEILGVLKPLLDPATTGKTYKFGMKLHGPCMTMMKRGFRIDADRVKKALHGDPEYTGGEDTPPQEVANVRAGLLKRMARLGGMQKFPERKVGKWQVTDPTAFLQQLAYAYSGKVINYHSPKDLTNLLYKAMRLPEQVKVEKGKVKTSTDHEALEHLRQNYPRAEMVCAILLRLRSLEKLVEVLEKGIDDDGRMRCSFNIAGTETGRLSSSSSVWDTGGNLQNITPELRRIFVPDPGYVLLNVDLEQAEARGVGYLARDEKYIAACESADLHTTVASMLFGIANDRKVAEKTLFYRHFTYRDMAKRAGHALNYGLSPASLARNMHISQKTAWNVYLRYLGGELRADKAATLEVYNLPHVRDGQYLTFIPAFPGIRQWHLDTQTELELNGFLVTPLGRRRNFWGRLDEAGTVREAIAYRPQSMIADILNEGMHRVWTEMEPECQLLAQVHDSICMQVPEKIVDSVAKRVLELLTIEIEIFGRKLVIPAEVKVGHDWRSCEKWTP